MRISTSSIYTNQTTTLDNLQSEYTQYAGELSSGISLNVPSDNPTVIAQDLAIRNDGAVTTQIGSNMTALTNKLTSVDSTMSSLVNILQQASSLAVQGADDTLSTSQRQELGTQANQLLQEAVGLANTQYQGQYIFGGSAAPTTQPLVQTSGNPITSVTSSGTDQVDTEALPNGEQLATGVTLQQAFNMNSTNGSPSVFAMLMNLRDTLNGTSVVDQSSAQVNRAGSTINPATTTIANLIGAGSPLSTPLTADSTGNVSINIASASSPSGATITFTPGLTVQQAIAAINAQTAATGVTASFNTQTQRLSLSSTTGAFQITDVSSPGATNTGNFVEAFGLNTQASTSNDLSTQLGDIKNVLQVASNARTILGSTIQAAQAVSSTDSTRVNNDQTIQSGYEDTDIAKVVAQFSATQTALQAAYGTTTRLEEQSLWNYLQGS